MRHSPFHILHSAFCILLFACTAAPPPPPALPPPPPPEPRVTSSAQRVVLLSFDGLSADEAESFGLFAGMPLRVRRVIPVNPTVTSSTHAAILTGQPPEVSGIVANNFHKAGTPRDETARGLEAEVQAETLLDVARRNGRRVGSIAFPTIDATTPRRTADFGVSYAKNLTAPRVLTLSRSDFRAPWMPQGWGAPEGPRHPSFSPVMRARLEWSVASRVRQDVDLAAYDSTDDRVANYDAFYVESDGSEQRIDGSRWFAVSRRLDDGVYGSWSKLLSAEPSLEKVTVYWGAIARTDIYPESFRKVVEEEAGFWPGVPDETNARSGAVGADTFREQVDRLSAFLTRATTVAMAHEPFALLLAYQPIIDQTEHPFRRNEPLRRAAFEAASRAVATIGNALDPARDALVVTGDHGMATVDTEVRMGRVLEEAGLAERWKVYTTGSFAELYRFDPPDDAPQLAERLASLRSPDGAPVFERIVIKNAGSHPDSGDLAAYAYPRFGLTSSPAGETFGVPASPGQHGALNVHRELHTTLGARGAGIETEILEELPQTEIAPFVRRLLGMP